MGRRYVGADANDAWVWVWVCGVLDTVHWFSGGLARVMGGGRDSWTWRSLSVVSLACFYITPRTGIGKKREREES